MKKRHRRTLVLNADYSPIGLISWKRAVVLSILNQEDPKTGLQIIDFYKNDFIQGTKERKYPIPAVGVTPIYVNRKKKKVPFSRKNLYIRDKLTCQYCGMVDATTRKLTFDHVVPRSQWKKEKRNGTPTCWHNIVTCCYPCNRKKANHPLEKTDMKLLKQPKEPVAHNFVLGLSPWCMIEKEWEIYLPQLYKDIIAMREENVYI